MPFRKSNKGHLAKKYHEDFQASKLSPSNIEPSITNSIKAFENSNEDSKEDFKVCNIKTSSKNVKWTSLHIF